MRGDEEEIRKNARATRLVVYAALAAWVTILWLASCALDAHGGQGFVEEYFVTGVNEQTGERVVGWIDGVLGESEVQGTVWDRTGQYVVVGIANGKGSFELRSLCCKYNVVVADEVSESKLQNRKLGEKNSDYIKFGK